MVACVVRDHTDFVSSAFAQTRNVPPQIPNTPARGKLDRWIRTNRSGDFETIRQFMLTSYAKSLLDQASADARATYLAESFRVNGGPRIFEIERSSDYEVVAVIQTELTELWSRLTIKVSSDPPHIVTSITDVPIPPPPGPPDAARLRDPQLAHWLDGYLAPLAAADIFSGSVLVARNGRPFFQKAYGLDGSDNLIGNRQRSSFAFQLVVIPTQARIACGIPFETVFAEVESILAAQADHAQDLHEVAHIGMKQMQVSIELGQHALRYRAWPSEPTAELILGKDRWARRRFRPVVQTQATSPSR